MTGGIGMIDRNTLLALRMERMHITAPAGSEEYDELFSRSFSRFHGRMG